MRGLYIHIPFCVRKCAYCDFYSLAGRQQLIPAYIDAMLTEARAYAGLAFQTLYLGGGTPSLLGAAGLRRLVSGLLCAFDLSGLTEATIEVNPDSATAGLLKVARETGINRISIGVQSLCDGELKRAGRVHNAAQALTALAQAKATGFARISADVIIGLPGQSWRTLQATVSRLTDSGISHISAYCLALEPGTPLAADPPANLPDDDMQAELFEKASSFLEAEGFSHYEISNFARPGHECQHNLNYWRGGEYLGLGPAAATHLDGRRFKNCDDLDAYLQNPTGLVEDVEELAAEAKVAEEAMLRLRLLREGIDMETLLARFGGENTESLAQRLEGMAANKLLVQDGSRYTLPPERVLISNPVFAAVLGG